MGTTPNDGGEAHTHDGGEAHTHDGGEAHTHDGGEAHTHDGGEAHTHDGGEAHTHDGGEAHTHDGGEAHTHAGMRVQTQGIHFMSLLLLFSCPAVSTSSVTSWTVTHQAPPSAEFSRQEYRSRLPFPLPGDLPYPGIKSESPALGAVLFTARPATKEAHRERKKSTGQDQTVPCLKSGSWLLW